MATNHLKQIRQLFFLDLLLFSFLIVALSFEVNTFFNLENPILFIIIGFAVSLSIKESSPARYAKLIFLSSLFFGFLFALAYMISGLINTNQLISDDFYFFVHIGILFGTIPNLFGGLMCIILKGIIEKLKVIKG